MSNTVAYRKLYEYKRHAGIPTSPVPAAPVRKHLQRLVDLGWTPAALESVTGISDQGLRFILNGNQRTVTRDTQAGVARMPYTLAVPDAVDDRSFVPAEGAGRRVRALLALGWRRADLADRLAETNPAHLARAAYASRIKAYRWREVADLYKNLYMQPGPSTINAARCVALGYVPPLGWTDIDDPKERPSGSRRFGGDWSGIDEVVIDRLLSLERVPTSTRAEKVEAMRRWVEAGNSQAALCRAHGWNQGRYSPRDEVAA